MIQGSWCLKSSTAKYYSTPNPAIKYDFGSCSLCQTRLGKDDCKDRWRPDRQFQPIVSCFRVWDRSSGWLGSCGRPGEELKKHWFDECQFIYEVSLMSLMNEICTLYFWKRGESIMAVIGVITPTSAQCFWLAGLRMSWIVSDRGNLSGHLFFRV